MTIPSSSSSSSSSNIESLTREERWLRWEQRGRDNDARLMRRVRRALWAAALVAIALLIFLIV